MIPSGQDLDDDWHDFMKVVALVLFFLAGTVLGWIAWKQ